MALPKLNDVPLYTMTVPSTGKQVKYRPFLVKEQKVLMLAGESQDKEQMLSSMLNTIESCIDDNINVKNLPTFDVDYLFTQIRAKSVGENANLMVKCSKCEKEVKFTVNLSELDVPKIKRNQSTIELTSDVSVIMRYPSYSLIMKNDIDDSDDNMSTEFTMHFMLSCIESIQTAEENILMQDETHEEQVRFLESLNTEQFEKLSDFVRDMPKISADVKLNCESCGHEESTKLEGMESFF